MTSSSGQDPAKGLWQRVEPEEMAKFSSFLAADPVPVGAIAGALSIEVISLTLPVDISGLIKQISGDQEKYQIQVNNTDAPVRQRFTVAHEIAHFLLHRSQIGMDGITDSILYRSKLSDRCEAEANRLAAAILLPWEKVLAWHRSQYGYPPHARHMEEIAKAFRVSSLAVGFRFGF